MKASGAHSLRWLPLLHPSARRIPVLPRNAPAVPSSSAIAPTSFCSPCRTLSTSPRSSQTATAASTVSSGTTGAPSELRRSSGPAFRLVGAISLLGAGYGLAVAFPPLDLFPRYLFFQRTPIPPESSSGQYEPIPMPSLPAHLDAASAEAYTATLEASLQSLSVVRQLREAYPKTYRPYTGPIADDISKRPGGGSLLGTTLHRPGALTVPPLGFATLDDSTCVSVLHVGPALCGHEGVIHGGLVASLLDEYLARPGLLNLPSGVGVTATLNLKYVKPTLADQFIVIKAQLIKREGRKAWVRGQIEDLGGTKLAEAEALYVEPRNAGLLGSGAKQRMRRAMGEEQLTEAGRSEGATLAQT